MNNDIIKQLEELEEEIDKLLYHVVGMSYNTKKALELKLKLEKKEDNKDERDGEIHK